MADARARELQEASTRLVLAGHLEPTSDIWLERSRATIDVNELSWALNGGREQLERK